MMTLIMILYCNMIIIGQVYLIGFLRAQLESKSNEKFREKYKSMLQCINWTSDEH